MSKIRTWRSDEPPTFRKHWPETVVPSPKRVLEDIRKQLRIIDEAEIEERRATKKRRATISAPRILREQPHLWYWAYGSNLCYNAMQRRCPGAVPIKINQGSNGYKGFRLNNGALMFRRVADVIQREGSVVHGGLWKITREHEATLDRFEGVRNGLYMKRYLNLAVQGEEVDCLYYQMRMTSGIVPPSQEYFEVLREGYQNFGLPEEALWDALDDAYDNKQVTRSLHDRRKREGGKSAKRKGDDNG